MRLVKPYFKIIEQQPGLEGIYKQIELAGRTCYKSTPLYRWYSKDKTRWINENSEEWKFLKNPKEEYPIQGENISSKAFVERMIKSGHTAMLEHGTVYLKLTPSEIHIYHKYRDNPYTNVNVVNSEDPYPVPTYYISTNYRVLVEQGWLNDLKYLCEPTEFHEKRITVHFILPIGISREFCRHRIFSFAEQSTRYCNFCSDKFNNELTFIEDIWCNEELLRQIEYWYINSYLKPQEKRNMLPLCTKTELVMTGFTSDWKHFFSLRDATSAHPQAQELAKPLHEEFIKNGWL